jgi:hypothetical protein
MQASLHHHHHHHQCGSCEGPPLKPPSISCMCFNVEITRGNRFTGSQSSRYNACRIQYKSHGLLESKVTNPAESSCSPERR